MPSRARRKIGIRVTSASRNQTLPSSGRTIPSTITMPVLVRDELDIAALHRRAGIAAILRDERLEIAIDETGAPRPVDA